MKPKLNLLLMTPGLERHKALKQEKDCIKYHILFIIFVQGRLWLHSVT